METDKGAEQRLVKDATGRRIRSGEANLQRAVAGPAVNNL